MNPFFNIYIRFPWRNLAQSVEHNIRTDAYNHVQKLDISWFENKKVGDITAKLNDDVNQLERFLDNGFNSIIQLCVSTVAIGCWFYISPLVASITILPVPIILLIAFFFSKKLITKILSSKKFSWNP